MQKIAEIVVLYILLLIISLPITACRFPMGRQYDDNAEESFVIIDNTMKSIEAKYQEIFRIPDNLCLYEDSPQYFELNPEMYYYIYEDNNIDNELYVGEFGHYCWKATDIEIILKNKKY